MSSDFEIEKWANDEASCQEFQMLLQDAQNALATGDNPMSDELAALHAHAKLLQLEQVTKADEENIAKMTKEFGDVLAQLAEVSKAGRAVCDAYQKERPGTVPPSVVTEIARLNLALPTPPQTGEG